MANLTDPCSAARKTFQDIINLEAEQERNLKHQELLCKSGMCEIEESKAVVLRIGGREHVRWFPTAEERLVELNREHRHLTRLFFSQINRVGPDCDMPSVPKHWAFWSQPDD